MIQHPGGISGANRRNAARKPTRCLGYIAIPGSRQEIECVLLDISASGARLKPTLPPAKPFQAAPSIPRQFCLSVQSDRTEIDCEVTWERGGECGVRFLSAFRPARDTR